jgi:predicted acylesterase/phospholipase RssA
MGAPRRVKTVIPPRKRIGFVCSGGAAKAGAYHLGVALALREKGFKFTGGLLDEDEGDDHPRHVHGPRDISIYVGSSAGSIISSFLAAGYSLDAIFESYLRQKTTTQSLDKVLKPISYNRLFSLRRDTGLLSNLYDLADASLTLSGFVKGIARDSYRNVLNMSWLKVPGFFTTAGIEKYMREDVLPSNDFKRYKADLFLVATQLNHSRKVVFGRYDGFESNEDKNCIYMNSVPISKAVAASTSLPPIFSPYPIPNESGRRVYYFDGEIRDTLSSHVAVDAGADLVFASYTHQPYHFNREIGSLHEYGLPMIIIQTIYLIIERKIQQHRQFMDRTRLAHDAVYEAMKSHGVPEETKRKVMEAFELKMNYKHNVHYIYIHPQPHDHEMFFGDHFNLNPHVLKEIVRVGFRNAIDVLRKYDFA